MNNIVADLELLREQAVERKDWFAVDRLRDAQLHFGYLRYKLEQLDEKEKSE